MNKKSFTSTSLLRIITLFLFIFILFPLNVSAQDQDVLDKDNFFESAPDALKDVIDKTQQISGDVFTKLNGASTLDSTKSFYDKIDDWFVDTTGLNIKEAFRKLLEIFISILSFFLNILRWILSLFN